MKRNISLDGFMIKNKIDFHNIISEKMNFGIYYGKNLNALWDMLTSALEYNYILQWDNSEYSKKMMGEEEFEKIINVFEELKEYNSKIGKENNLEYFLN